MGCFNQTKLEVTHSSRHEGSSTYSFKKLLNLALDIILAFSDKTIRLTIKFGFLISLISFIYFQF
jgi:dolichol-phosphate mannosyltransferase